MTDLTAGIYYLLTIELLGLLAWPFVRRLLKDLPDQGWAFAKIAGILLVGWSVWLLASFRLVPFTFTNTIILALVMGAFSWFFGDRSFSKDDAKKLWSWILIEEVLFIGCFAIWTYVRGFSPAINGLEKFMDYGFMLSAYKSQYFPPLDHFLARETINYYYFGHYLAAMISKLSTVPTEFAYNLQMSLIMALGLMQSFSLGAALFWHSIIEEAKRIPWRSWISGVIAATTIIVAGNLHTLIYLRQQGDKYWYPDATRFIENTIHEFPIYSFIVNDLHGHVSDIPIVLIILAILFTMFRTLFLKELTQKHKAPESVIQIITLGLPVSFITLAWVIGTTYATNAWDFAIYLIVSGLLIWSLRATQQRQQHSFWASLFKPEVLLRTAINSIFLVSFAILFYIPFWRNLVPISQGIGIVPPGGSSPLWQLSVLWGVHLPLTFILVMWILNVKFNQMSIGEQIVKLFAGLFNVKINIDHKESEKQPKQEGIRLFNATISPVNFFVLTMFFVSMLLIIAPEFIFIRDIYPTHYRANTMFKFYYQAWIMLGLIVGYGVIRMWAYFNEKPSIYGYLFKALSLVLIYASLLYPYKAIQQGFALKQPRQSIDGLAYLKTSHPGDYSAIKWINENIQGQPTLLEGVGDSYTDYARIASNTALPAVIGWPVHEWLWRGTYDKSMVPQTEVEKKTGQVDTVGTRVEEARLIYESADIEETRRLLNKYEVQYIYLGDLERQKYPLMNENKFAEMGLPVVYDKENVKIYLVQ